MKLYQLTYACRIYTFFADFDRSRNAFRERTGHTMNVGNPAHCAALFDWLRSWRCRQFSKAHEHIASDSLTAWAAEHLTAQVFPPWDAAIRRKLSSSGHQNSYKELLMRVRAELRELVEDAGRLGLSEADIPARVGRPHSSLPKLVDEYHWVTLTKKVVVPTPEELEELARWAAPPDTGGTARTRITSPLPVEGQRYGGRAL